MILWKKKKKKKAKKNKKISKTKAEQAAISAGSHAKTSSAKKSVRAVVWIDPQWPDVHPRLIRGLGIVEALHANNVNDIIFVAPASPTLSSTFDRLKVTRQDLTTDSVLTPQDIIAQTTPDMIWMDTPTQREFQQEKPYLFSIQLSDTFVQSLFDQIKVNAIVVPGIITPPVLEELTIPPSHLANCVHGANIVPLPMDYLSNQKSKRKANRITIGVSGEVSVADIKTLYDSIQQSCTQLAKQSLPISLLVDCPESTVIQLEKVLPDSVEILHACSIEERLRIMDESYLAVLTDGLQIYEWLVRGKPIIILATTDAQKERFAPLVEQKALCVVNSAPQLNTETLNACLKQLIEQPGVVDEMGYKAGQILEPEGAKSMIGALLERYRYLASLD